MSDSASDTSETVVAPAKPRKSFRPQRRASSPTLVPGAQPDSTDPIIELLQRAAAGKKSQPRVAADRADQPSNELPAAPDQSIVPDLSDAQNLPAAEDLPEAVGADIASGDLSPDALSLLQELARKNTRKNSDDDQTPHTPAAPSDATPPPSAAVADMVAQLDSDVRELGSTRASTGRKFARFAIAGLSVILASSVAGLVLLGGMPALNNPPAEPSAVPAAQVRPQVAPAQTAAAECDPAGVKDPFEQFVFSTPDALVGKTRQAAELSGADYGWYSLMSLKAKLERHGGGC